MDSLVALITLVGGFLLLDVLAVTLGVDSRDTLPDDHHR
jgi:hypothetical protein